ncbi:TonB-dependent siderophore receptor [Actinobacillus suis]|uniref:Ferrioxamine B receptor n=2 Tax=Actinobacillus suis TaxID=716 RepID=K0G9F2_ACTSU|nr:TonB-dependent siderophore receptor [Actinobacillus suis]AFU20364.1 ferrioxamine B receptor precursor [Actinobacillus suis H91-0380]AIJ32495.1 ferrioxamine B receptor precursor [Actinobacillus suis ATCC 33415]MCO4170075.1 TonB-dependent siderophore receptor [Actinobacillus suis]MCQ9630761.1 TonB-dependent siderophore receptor [Actinobacillus suis]MCQ9633094.1 TonB-dependent siderophore receptor [Actinobacillus suis]
MKKTFFYSTVASAVALAISPAIAQETAVLDEVSVVGSVSKAGKVEYMTPKSVSVLTEEQIKEKGYKQADEIGRYEAGILSQPYGGDIDTHDWIRIRGFSPTLRIDGTAMYSFGFYHWQPNMYGLESIEVVKGADSLTYGSAQSGGLINLVSKRPTKEPKGELKFTLGNRNERGFSADYSNAISENVRFRLVGDFNRRDGEPKGSYMDAYYFAPSLSWDISKNTSLTLLASVQHDNGRPSSGFFPAGYERLSSLGLSNRTNFAENVPEYLRRNQYSVGYEFTHKFSDDLVYQSNYRYAYSNKDQFSASIGWDGSSLSTMTARGKTFTHSLDNRLSKTWAIDRVENILTVGFDYTIGKNYAANGYGSEILSNLYGNYPTAVQPFDAVSPYVNKEKQLGVYVQNQFRFDNKLLVNLGARRDFAKGDYYSTYGGEGYDLNHNSYSAGVMYVTDSGLSPFYNYSESFRPISGSNVNGHIVRYKPYEGSQHEVGFKYLPSFVDGTLSIAYFDLKEKNGLVQGQVNGQVIQLQTEKAKSKGVELQTDMKLNDNISALLAYTYTDAKVNNIRKAIIPRHTYSAFMNYAFTNNTLVGLKVGAGVRYVGTSTNGVIEEKIPAYTLVDLMAKYDFNKHWVAQVNVSNLSNKKYISACDTYWCYMGEGRKVTANLTYKF